MNNYLTLIIIIIAFIAGAAVIMDTIKMIKSAYYMSEDMQKCLDVLEDTLKFANDTNVRLGNCNIKLSQCYDVAVTILNDTNYSSMSKYNITYTSDEGFKRNKW